MPETRTALDEIRGRVVVLERQIDLDRKASLEAIQLSQFHEGRITEALNLRRDYNGLLAKLEA